MEGTKLPIASEEDARLEIEEVIPQIAEILYNSEASSIDEVTEEIINLFKSFNQPIWYQAANKLREYSKATTPKAIISGLQRHCKKWKTQNGYRVSISFSKRKKSLVKMLQKIFLFIFKTLTSAEIGEMRMYSLNNICDDNGIRIIVDFGKDNDCEDDFIILDELLNEVIYYFVGKCEYICKTAEPLVGINFSQNEHPEVYIPKNSSIKQEFLANCKDYYRNPKKNGYQSYHLIFEKAGKKIEVQIRTLVTHVRIENNDNCSHANHDAERYSTIPSIVNSINWEKVRILGFYANGTCFHDDVCLVKSSGNTVI